MIEKQVFFLDIIGRGEAFSKHRFQVSGVRFQVSGSMFSSNGPAPHAQLNPILLLFNRGSFGKWYWGQCWGERFIIYTIHCRFLS